jgi:hypothetical protein
VEGKAERERIEEEVRGEIARGRGGRETERENGVESRFERCKYNHIRDSLIRRKRLQRAPFPIVGFDRLG